MHRFILQLDRNTEQAQVVDVMMARAKAIYILMIKVNSESLGELEKAVETLACGLCSHSISHSPKLPLVFLLLDSGQFFVSMGSFLSVH